jgi:hypothetical protein
MLRYPVRAASFGTGGSSGSDSARRTFENALSSSISASESDGMSISVMTTSLSSSCNGRPPAD